MTETEQTDAPARERINDKHWAAELGQRNQSCIDSAGAAAYRAYRAVTDPTGMPAPHADALNAAVGAALQAVATAWREDATRWRTAGKRGWKSTADELTQAASRVAGVAVGLASLTLQTGQHGTVERAEPVSPAALGSVCGSVDPIAPTEPPCMRADVDHDGSCVNRNGRRWPRPTPPSAAQQYLSGQVDIYDPPDSSSDASDDDVTPWPTIDGGDGAGLSLLDPATATDVTEQSGAAVPGTVPQIFDPTSAADRVISYAHLLSHRIGDDQRPDHRSVSQLETYTDCGLKYRLQRYHMADAPAVPQWSLVGGTAFHYAVETIERVGLDDNYSAQRVWLNAFGRAIDEQMEADEQTHPLEQWRAAAKGLEGYDWWRVTGESMVEQYLDWSSLRHASGWVIAADNGGPDQTRYIEYPFQVEIGDVRVDGIIDQVWHNNQIGAVEIVDLKSGARIPDDTLQLAVYAYAVGESFGAGPFAGGLTGAYYNARKGELTPPVDIWARHSPDELVYRFAQMDQAERAGLYPPRPSSFCGGCSVRPYCPAVSH